MLLLHGWDPDSRSWYGPVETPTNIRMSVFDGFRMCGDTYCGHLALPVDGLPDLSFYTVMHDLGDCAVATIGLDTPGKGLLAAIIVLPECRRDHLRPDFAFELASFLRFLRVVDAGDELPIHDYIEAVAITDDPHGSVAFSIVQKGLDTETTIVVTSHLETLAAALLRWQEKKSARNAASARA